MRTCAAWLLKRVALPTIHMKAIGFFERAVQLDPILRRLGRRLSGAHALSLLWH